MNRERLKRIASLMAVPLLTFVLLGGALTSRHLRLDHARVVARVVRADGSVAVTLLSSSYDLDRIYKSMHGPRSNQSRIRLAVEPNAHDVLWLTGVSVTIVDPETHEPISDEYFCHSNLTFNPETMTPEQHNASFEPELHADWRLFTLIPGRLDIQLPEGFGVPIRSHTLLDNFTMALNQKGVTTVPLLRGLSI